MPNANGLAIKRALDLSVAIVAAVITLPLMAAIAIVIKLRSRGQVLYVQDREARGGGTFRIHKFRTMVPDADRHGSVSTMDDRRITNVGRFLRRTSLDELPQLFDVIRGDMSLVGPRPLLPGTTRPNERRRLAMRPGMTGLVEVRLPHRLTWDQRMAVDLEYVDRWSLSLDASILVRTIPIVLRRKDAVDPPREEAT